MTRAGRIVMRRASKECSTYIKNLDRESLDSDGLLEQDITTACHSNFDDLLKDYDNPFSGLSEDRGAF